MRPGKRSALDRLDAGRILRVGRNTIVITGQFIDLHKCQTDPSPSEGRLWYNATEKALKFGDGSSAKPLVSAPITPSMLDSVNTPADGYVLRYNGAAAKFEWYQISAGGVAGGAGAPGRVVAASNAPDWIKSRADYVCDGIDDQAEINQALQESLLVILSPGAFKVTDSITIPSNRVLMGCGPSTLIYLDGPKDRNINTIRNSDQENGNQKIALRDFVMSSSVTANQTGYWVAMYFKYVQDLLISNIRFQTPGHDIVILENCNRVAVGGCCFSQAPQISPRWGSSGIRITNSSFILIDRNIFDPLLAYAIYTTYELKRCIISNNIFDAAYYNAMKILGIPGSSAEGVTILNNFFRGGNQANSGLATVRLENPTPWAGAGISDVMIAGNRFDASSLAYTPSCCVEIATGGIGYTMIHGNNFRNGGAVAVSCPEGVAYLARDNVDVNGQWMADTGPLQVS